jgi:hypothetical protein
MTVKWKIFRVANIAEILVVAGLLALILLKGRFSFKNTADIIGLSAFFTLGLIIIGNSINNILLLGTLSAVSNPPFPRRILFWILVVLVFLTFGFIIVALIASYPVLEKTKGFNKNFDPWLIAMLIWFAVIALTGFYIFFLQIILFLKIKKKNKEAVSSLVNEIGESVE